METDSVTTSEPGSSIAHGSPTGDVDEPRIALYSPEFAADPHGSYRDMRRRYGTLVPVELAPGVPATLVIGYDTAKKILHDDHHFPADPRRWQKNVPADCPIMPMVEWRPNALRSSGEAHKRYREANKAAIEAVDVTELPALVEEIAFELIRGFCERSYADLLNEYASPLVFAVLCRLMGTSPEVTERIRTGMAMIFDASADAEAGNLLLGTAIAEHVALVRADVSEGRHRDDITSRLVTHRANLDDMEMLHQIVTLFGAGFEPMLQLISNTLLLMMTDPRFGGQLVAGSLSTADGLDEQLFADPPLANYCLSYPVQPQLVDGVWLPPDQPVVISMAACNTDPSVTGGDITGNRSHLAFSLGPHACPARDLGQWIATSAIDQLLDALPDVQLAVDQDQLEWRPGPFHRALVALPVTFPPIPAKVFPRPRTPAMAVASNE